MLLKDCPRSGEAKGTGTFTEYLSLRTYREKRQQLCYPEVHIKFFKHFVDAHDGYSMQSLMNKFGLAGYAAYFILIEMCAAKLDKGDDESYSEVHCKFRFSARIVRQKLRMSSTKVEQWLNYSSTLNLLEFTRVQDEFTFYVPKLLESLDRDAKRARKERGPPAPKPRQEEEKELDEEKEKERELILYDGVEGPPPPAMKIFNRSCWEAYRQSYTDRYNVEPVRNARLNSQIATFVKRVGGKDAPDIVRFYLKHMDSRYIKNTHTFGFCLMDAETLRTQWLKGQSITGLDIRRFEKEVERKAETKVSQSTIDDINSRIMAQNAKKGIVPCDQ